MPAFAAPPQPTSAVPDLACSCLLLPALACCACCADKLNKEKEWDQSVWNEAIFFLSHGDYKSPQVRVVHLLFRQPSQLNTLANSLICIGNSWACDSYSG
jgi:hypothetical protein